MSTTTNRITTCDNCHTKIVHTYEWPPGWAHLQLGYRDIKGYVVACPIELDLCPNCAHQVENVMLETLGKIKEKVIS